MLDVQKTNKYLTDILAPEKGYFGRVSTLGQGKNEYWQMGFIPSENFESMLSGMTDEQRKTLMRMARYFEMHALPLKKLLNAEDSEQLYKFYSEIAWSHFATIVMFGMLEVAVKGKIGLQLKAKGQKIKKFLEDNLPQDTKNDVVRRYSTEAIFKHSKHKTFGEVVDHLWDNVRCGFVHDVGLESKGLEYGSLVSGGTKERPTITIRSDVPMPEWLQLTWQAIFNSYGYKGILESPKLTKEDFI